MPPVVATLLLLLIVSAGPVATAHADVAKDAAARIGAALPAGLEVVDIIVPPSLAAARGEVAVAFAAAPRAGRVSVRLSVRDGARERSGWAQVELARPRPVLVAARALTSGKLVGAGDLTLVRRAVSSSRPAWRIAARALAGVAILRDVPAGSIVTDGDVAAPAPVPRGTRVAVVIARAGFAVSSPGVLERAARPGEPASARVDASRRIVSGRLIDGHTLQVEAMP
ncbi:MAG: flagellar basal body P-ring formation protein FlgA [Myxococcales bacterium]|nr:flagellar basal body P-ring formation protein FlgA [Myxococcales bacterium]